MTICPKCAREKISADTRTTRFPDYRVVGSYIEYCGYCDEPPALVLSSQSGYVLERIHEREAAADS